MEMSDITGLYCTIFWLNIFLNPQALGYAVISNDIKFSDCLVTAVLKAKY